MIFYFDKTEKNIWTVRERQLQTMISFGMAHNHSFQVEIKKLAKKKTHAQLRGFHRLINILIPYFKDWTGQAWDEDSVKDLIKRRNGFVKHFKGMEITKSCKDATLEEMMGLIKEVETFAAEMEVENCHLESQEWKELESFYQNRK